VTSAICACYLPSRVLSSGAIKSSAQPQPLPSQPLHRISVCVSIRATATTSSTASYSRPSLWRSLCAHRSLGQPSRLPRGIINTVGQEGTRIDDDQVHRSSTRWYGSLRFGLVSKTTIHCRLIGQLTIRCSSAKDQLTGQPVAVKKIMKPFSTPVLSKRTYRELKLLKHLRHENVGLQTWNCSLKRRTDIVHRSSHSATSSSLLWKTSTSSQSFWAPIFIGS